MKPARQAVAPPEQPRAVVLEGRPELLTLPEYAAVMRQAERTVRRELARGTCRVAPCIAGRGRRAYLWARVDLEAYLSRVTVTEDRRRQLRIART